MSIEITRRCPLSCPGCYAYSVNHLGASGLLARLSELEGTQLVEGVLSLVDLHRPLHLSIVGGEPLIRQHEITWLLPELNNRGIHTQIVTSAFQPIPIEWRHRDRLNLVVSIDGLPEEHDRRRAPATYERILRNIRGHDVTVHCTVTRQMTRRSGYLREFTDFWTKQPETRKIWMSLYTPQAGETSPEILRPHERSRVIGELSILKDVFPKLELPDGLLQAYKHPPSDPARCTFALTTQTVSADLRTAVTPCQIGGTPDCRQCGCIAAAAMEAVSRHRLAIGVRAGTIFGISRALGLRLKAIRDGRRTVSGQRWEGAIPAAQLHCERDRIVHERMRPQMRPHPRGQFEQDAPKMRA